MLSQVERLNMLSGKWLRLYAYYQSISHAWYQIHWSECILGLRKFFNSATEPDRASFDIANIINT